MAEKPFSKPTDEIQNDLTTSDSNMAKDKGTLAPEEGGSSKKGTGLLKVPSRSSSHKNQSPTSTGLSGATASESRNSIGGRSKDSKASFLGRQRNGSATSKRTGGDSEPTNTPANSHPSSPVQKRKKKSGGLLSLLGCCGAPDTGNAGEDSENVHKLDKLPQRPATAKSRTHTPQDQAGSKQVNEKEPETSEQRKDQAGAADAEDTISPVDKDPSKQTAAPAVTVEPPTAHGTEDESGTAGKANAGADVAMQDASAEESKGADASTTAAEAKTIPPPPGPTAPITLAEPGPAEAEPQKWLLPPIAPEHKGRKCLVLDLDETLVHSSFKVCVSIFGWPTFLLTMDLDTAPSRLYYSSGDRR